MYRNCSGLPDRTTLRLNELHSISFHYSDIVPVFQTGLH